MTTTGYRAAYWVDRNTGAEVRLTSEEHAHLSDEELIAEARRYAEELGDMDLSYGEIIVIKPEAGG